MKRNFLLSIFIIISCLTLTGYSDNNFFIKSQGTKKNIQTEMLINDTVEVYQANDVTITMRDIAFFLEGKKEHYPLSDEFVERYQQSDGGYIDNAIKAGLVVDKQRHEPNQKWHFFESWLYPSIEEGTLTWEESAQSRVYNKLLCPELLLWIYEAADVNPNKVRAAKEVAEKAKVEKTHISTMAKNMRQCVPWEDIEKTIINFMNANSEPFSVFINEGEGFAITGLDNEYKAGSEVSFNINVTDSTKTIDEVRVNNDVLEPDSGSAYKFIMPSSEVTIYVSLKEIKLATNVVLSQNSLELTIGETKTISAVVEPIDTTDVPLWSVIEGEDLINITPINNEVKVYAVKPGTAKINILYNENVNAECLITIKEKTGNTGDTSNQTLAVYNIKYDLGDRVTSKELGNTQELFESFEFSGQGSAIITSVSQMERIYGGAYGGSGESRWYTGDILKFGTTSVNGSLTLVLNSEVNRVKITGYVGDNACKLRIGDESSTDWIDGEDDNKTTLFTCADMNETSKEIVEGKQTSTVVIDFESTKNLRIATTNSKPFYITSIEFIFFNN